MNAKLKWLTTFTKDSLKFLAAPEHNRVRFTGYYPETKEYFQDYYFTSFFDFKQKPDLSSVFPTIEFFSVWNNVRSKAEKSKAKIKVFFTGECVHSEVFKEFNDFEDHFLNIIDLALGFDYINNKKYIRYPLWVLYLFDQPEFSKDKIKQRIDCINENFANLVLSRLKTKDCSIIARHDKNGIRSSICNCAEKAGLKIFAAGTWNHNDDSLWNEFANDKQKYLEQFRYAVCPENYDYEGYVTEKLFQSFLSGCIPIYCGSNNAPEPQVVNPNAVLFYDKDKPEELSQKLKDLQDNPKKIEEIARQKPLKDSAVDFIYDLNKKTKDLCTEIANSKGIL